MPHWKCAKWRELQGNSPRRKSETRNSYQEACAVNTGDMDELPDAASRSGDHGLAGAARKRFVKFGHVLQDTVYAIAAGGMRIGLSTQPGCLGAYVLAPDLA